MKKFPEISIVFNQKPSGMTKNHICANDFLKIIGFSRKLKESRINLNDSKQLKNSSESQKKIKYY